jgi:hypothetical protein
VNNEGGCFIYNINFYDKFTSTPLAIHFADSFIGNLLVDELQWDERKAG